MKTSLLLLTAIILAACPSCTKQTVKTEVTETRLIWGWQGALTK